MPAFNFIFDIGVIVVAAAALVLLARLIRIPTIVVYIVTGLLLGPITGAVGVDHAVEIISELGIALLLFLVGLELSLDKIRDVGKVAVAAGIGQVVFTAMGGFALSFVLGFSVIESVFIAVALTFSSTVVVVKLLTEKKEINELYGRIAVGIFLVQDIVVIIALTFLAGLSNPQDLELASVVTGVGKAFAGMAVLMVIALGASKFVLPTVFGWVARSMEAVFVWGLTWCFALVLAAEVLELSVEIGAFLAGISLAQLPISHELRRRVHPLVNFFIAIFFVSLGIQMELGAAQEHWQAALLLSLFVLVGKALMFMFIIARFGYGRRTNFLTSITVAQISEFSFVFAALALSTGFIDEAILSVVAFVGLVTIAGSSYMITFNHQLYGLVKDSALFRMISSAREDDEQEEIALIEDHIIVVGMNSLGRRLVRRLAESGERVFALDTDIAKLAQVDVPTIIGDAVHPEILDKAGLNRAKLLVSTLQIEETNNMLAFRCGLAGVPCSIHAFDRSVYHDLQELGATNLIRSKEEGLQRVIRELRDREVVPG